MQAQTEPQTRPCRASSRLTFEGSMCDVSSTGISTVSKPQRLNCLNSFVLSLVKGEVKRKVLMPIRITRFEAIGLRSRVNYRMCEPLSWEHGRAVPSLPCLNVRL